MIKGLVMSPNTFMWRDFLARVSASHRDYPMITKVEKIQGISRDTPVIYIDGYDKTNSPYLIKAVESRFPNRNTVEDILNPLKNKKREDVKPMDMTYKELRYICQFNNVLNIDNLSINALIEEVELILERNGEME